MAGSKRAGVAVERAGPTAGREWLFLPKGRLAELAERVQQICGRGWTEPTRVPSGFEALDEALGGGFELGAVHELITWPAGAAGRVVALCTAARAAGTRRWIVYIDTGRDFYPPGAHLLGVPLARLIVVRPGGRAEALWACEQVLRCRQIAAVVMPVRYLDWRESRRLQLASEAGESLGLLLTTPEAVRGHSFAASRLRFEPLADLRGVRQLKGQRLRLRVAVLKVRGRALAEPLVLELGEEADRSIGSAGGLCRRVAG